MRAGLRRRDNAHVQVLLVTGPLEGSMPAPRVIEIMSAAWLSRTADAVTGVVASDGGAGLLDAVAHARGGHEVRVEVPGPLGGPVPARVLQVPEAAGRTTAYVEANDVLGRHRPDLRRSALRGTSEGVGRLLAAALDLGAGRVVVGLGPSAVLDGGAGLLRGLGLPGEHLGVGAAGLPRLRAADLDGLAALRDRLGRRDVLVACAEDFPLLGPHGAAAAAAARGDLDAAAAQDADRALGHLAVLLEGHAAATPASRRSLPLLAPGARTGLVDRPAPPPTRRPYSGAGGGVAFALAILGARIVAGAALVADVVGLAGAVARADLVVYAGDRLDADATHGGILPAVGAAALAAGVPVVGIAAAVVASRRELARIGVVGAHATQPVPGPFAGTAGATPAERLAATTARVATTYSPRR